MNSNKSIKTALLFSAIGQYSAELIGFATIMILARLLSPEEVGVYAIAGTVTLIAAELRSLGAVQFLVREKDIHENKIRAVLGMTIIVSWGLGLLLILSSQYISDFYDEPALKKIFWILSITFFVGPFSSIPFALWMRNMQFKHIFIMKFVGEIFTSIGMITFVLLDYSYYGLALGVIIGLFSRLLIGIILQPPGTVWIPKFSLEGNLVKFGLFTSSSNLLLRFSDGIPDLVIGKVASMADVGQFSRGFGAILFINKLLATAVAPVVLPHLSEVKRSGRSVTEAYLRSIKLLLAFTWPALAVTSAASYPLINVLFGDQWNLAVSVTSILAVWAILTSVHSFSASAFIVSGTEKLMFTSGLVVYVFRLILVIFTAPYGLEAVAWAMVISGIIELFIKSLALKKSIGLMMYKLIFALWPNFLIALMCWLTTIMIDQIYPFKESNPLLSLGIIAICVSLVWLLMLRLTKHEVWILIWEIINKFIDVPLMRK